jgi:hypothetical protein
MEILRGCKDMDWRFIINGAGCQMVCCLFMYKILSDHQIQL